MFIERWLGTKGNWHPFVRQVSQLKPLECIYAEKNSGGKQDELFSLSSIQG